jgi:23S rRNA pseudouridine2605 synthase
MPFPSPEKACYNKKYRRDMKSSAGDTRPFPPKPDERIKNALKKEVSSPAARRPAEKPVSSKTLIKALTESGAGSRRRMADAIKQGKVTVNGTVAEAFSLPVDIRTTRITLDGKPVNLRPEAAICLMLNKPAGIVSTASDEKGRLAVLDILPDKYQKYRLYPAGRLDKETTGLLLLTNDGDLTYRLTHPRFEHEKEYLVVINGRLSAEAKQRLAHGIRLEDGLTHPARIKEIADGTFNYSLVIHEGRKRQVHRMFERIGHSVLALKRVRIGNLSLGNLKEGEVRQLNAREINALFEK